MKQECKYDKIRNILTYFLRNFHFFDSGLVIPILSYIYIYLHSYADQRFLFIHVLFVLLILENVQD